MRLKMPVLVMILLPAWSAIACTTEEVRPRGDDRVDEVDDRDFDRDAGTIGGTADAEIDLENIGDLDLVCGPRLLERPYIPTTGEFILRDDQTQSLWNILGQAFSGPCEGARLEAMPSFIGMWFAWSGTHPGGAIWPDGINDQPGPEADTSGGCEVPCNDILSGGPPPDGIPALDHLGRWNRPKPAKMVPIDEISYLRDRDKVLGVTIDGESRAYPHNLGWWHEIHTDQIGDVEFSVTFCPLTASGLVYPTEQSWGSFVPYVSGRLYNSNLTMWERDSDNPTSWNQMLGIAISGPLAGEHLTILPVAEMTWARWKELHPDSLVASDDTGYERDYTRYPYGDFETNHDRWVVRPTLGFGDEYQAKDLVLAVDGPDSSKAWPWPAMDAISDRVVINDELDDISLVVVYDAEHSFAQPYQRRPGDISLTFRGVSAP
ncbi:MAG: DUF3179 domain-containing (seleno)protein [Bradymonadaceae bacterium]